MKNNKGLWILIINDFCKKLLITMGIGTVLEAVLFLLLRKYIVVSFIFPAMLVMLYFVGLDKYNSNVALFTGRLGIPERTVFVMRCVVYAAGFLILYMYQKLLLYIFLAISVQPEELVTLKNYISLYQTKELHSFFPLNDKTLLIRNYVVPILLGISRAAAKTLNEHDSGAISRMFATLASISFTFTVGDKFYYPLIWALGLFFTCILDCVKSVGLSHSGERLSYVEK